MILIIYEILLFLIICFSYFLIQTGFMSLHFGSLTSLFGMFTANLVMYYLLLYRILEYKNKTGFRRLIHVINAIMIVISLILLVLLIVQFINSQ